ncbi:MAG: sugar ABC transporter ATP-binding protein [Rhodoferax sp.]|nr:sugar ABC transporter ATP-binding protein [Rhodoferax sp.]
MVPYLQVKNISKTFAGVKALNRVSLHVARGEVLAIAGENGAGKSTLMKIMTGVYQPDPGGEIWINGVLVPHLTGTAHARQLGVCIIYQELSVVDNLTIAENIFLSKEIANRLGFLDKRAMHAATRQLLDSLDMQLDPGTRVGDLSIGQKQMVEIAKAISNHSKIVIMDEPTASLSHHEATVLKETIRKLRSDGIGIIYITHRLEEIFDLADRVTVLRDGASVGTLPIEQLDRARLVKMMVDREQDDLYGDYQCHATQKVALEVKGLTLKHRTAHTAPVRDCSFRVHEGEILGFFGLVGAGRTELMEMVFGLRPYHGAIELGGRSVAIHSPRAAIDYGLGFVTEDRKSGGLVLGMNIRENFSLTHLETYSTLRFISRLAETFGCQKYVKRLGIKTPSVEQTVGNLSGGNQQKVVIAKWVARSPKVLIVDEPTRGIDIAAKADVHRLLQELAARGMAIIVVSSDLPEVLAISDRVIVVREGAIAAELPRQQATQQTVMEAAAA